MHPEHADPIFSILPYIQTNTAIHAQTYAILDQRQSRDPCSFASFLPHGSYSQHRSYSLRLMYLQTFYFASFYTTIFLKQCLHAGTGVLKCRISGQAWPWQTICLAFVNEIAFASCSVVNLLLLKALVV